MRRRRSLRVTRAGIAWGLVLAATALAVVLAGLTTALRTQRPALALRISSGDGPALARRASELLLSGEATPAATAQARVMARAALARDATLTEAWRTLALTDDGDAQGAIRLFRTAQTLSRRDLPTQLALIEYQVQRGDVVGALRHYDVILRTSSAYDSILFPILTGASGEPAVRNALAAKLVTAPIWRRRFLSYLVNAGVPIDQQADLFGALAAAGPLADRDIVAAQASTSALGGQYAAADRLFRLVSPGQARRALRGGGFDDEGDVPPFSWQYDDGDALDVVVAAVDGNRRLEIVSRRGDGARAARQLLSLPPGAYRLDSRYGAIEDLALAVPRLTLSCAEGGGAIAGVDGRAASRLRSDIVIPAGCTRQWLEIALPQNPAGTAVGAWIDDVAVAAKR